MEPCTFAPEIDTEGAEWLPLPTFAEAALVADMPLYTSFVALTTQRKYLPSVASGGSVMLFDVAVAFELSAHALPSDEYCHLYFTEFVPIEGRPPTEHVSFPPMTALPEIEAVIEAVPFLHSLESVYAVDTL